MAPLGIAQASPYGNTPVFASTRFEVRGHSNPASCGSWHILHTAIRAAARSQRVTKLILQDVALCRRGVTS